MRPTMSPSFPTTTEMEIEEFLCGDASPASEAKLEALMISSPAFAAHIRAREAERERFYAKHPRLLVHPPEPVIKRLWAWAFAGGGALVVAAAVLFLVLRAPGDSDSVTSEVRVRGAVKASLVVLRGERVFPHKQGVLLRKGDQVRLMIETPKAGFLSLIGRDDTGTVSVYYDSVPVGPGTSTLAGSLVLDDFVGKEQWFVFLSKSKSSADAWAQTLRSGASPAVPMTVLQLVKEETW